MLDEKRSGTQSRCQLDDGIMRLILRSVQGKVGVSHIDQCRQTAGNRTGHDVTLTKNHPRLVNVRRGETIPLRRSKGMFILDMWFWIPTGLARAEAPEANCSGDVLIRLMLEARQQKELGESVRYLRPMKMNMREKKRWSAKMKRRSRRAQRLSLIWDSQAGENENNMRQLTRNTGVGALRA